jgi:hypothetical protein
VARKRGACEEACEEECEPNPKPRPKPKTSSADVAERGVASIGVRSSGNLCVEEEYVSGEAGAHSTKPTYTTGNDSPAREPSWSAFWLQKPSILRVCVRKEDAGGGSRARILLNLHIQRETIVLRGSRTGRRLVAETIHPVGMCEGGGRGGRAIGPENAVGEWARRRQGE